jgi:hypothetical protein
MIAVVLQSLFLAVSIWVYRVGDTPLQSMFAIGWCSAFTLHAFVKAISHPHASESSQDGS